MNIDNDFLSLIRSCMNEMHQEEVKSLLLATKNGEVIITANTELENIFDDLAKAVGSNKELLDAFILLISRAAQNYRMINTSSDSVAIEKASELEIEYLDLNNLGICLN